MAKTESTIKHVGLRLDKTQFSLVRRAAKAADMSLQKFMVKVAVNAARVVLKQSDLSRPSLGEVAGQKLISDQDSIANGA